MIVDLDLGYRFHAVEIKIEDTFREWEPRQVCV